MYYTRLPKLFKGRRKKKTTGKKMFPGALMFFSGLVHDGYIEFLVRTKSFVFFEKVGVDELQGSRAIL